MITLFFGILSRIFSNTYINVYQKILSSKGEKSSVINFYTYFGLCILSLMLINPDVINNELIINSSIMGVLGAFGNYFIIKAFSIADLSSIAPINSYKPIIALIIGILYLHEIPSVKSIAGIMLIILGTYYLYFNKKNNFKPNKLAVFYRLMALILSGTEAIFIKKVIILSDVYTALALWAIFGFIFSLIVVNKNSLKIKIDSIKSQILLILLVFIMQLSTNYVFSIMNVAYALAIFQLSTILSVILGVKIFNEHSLKQKLIGSLIMIAGAVVIILN